MVKKLMTACVRMYMANSNQSRPMITILNMFSVFIFFAMAVVRRGVCVAFGVKITTIC